MAAWSTLLAAAFGLAAQAAAESVRCPGKVHVAGLGEVSLTNAKWNVPGELAGDVSVTPQGVVDTGIVGRAYFTSSCQDGAYNHSDYLAVPLLGKTFSYTTHLKGAGCGCNAALYLTSLHQSTQATQCEDYYCDANRVCGVACAEIDLQEANEFAWHSTLHVHDDGSGDGFGYGGGGTNWNNNRDWNWVQYGPGGRCIDTNEPFRVAVSFPVDSQGMLVGMETHLSQPGKECSLTHDIRSYRFNDRDGVRELTEDLRKGMTPIVSYWKADDMLWFDGPGQDGQGPNCHKGDSYAQCSESVQFSDFAVEDIQHRRLSPSILV